MLSTVQRLLAKDRYLTAKPLTVFSDTDSLNMDVIVSEFDALKVKLEEAVYLQDVVLNKDVLPITFTIAETFQRVFFNWHSKEFHAYHETLFKEELEYEEKRRETGTHPNTMKRETDWNPPQYYEERDWNPPQHYGPYYAVCCALCSCCVHAVFI